MMFFQKQRYREDAGVLSLSLTKNQSGENNE